MSKAEKSVWNNKLWVIPSWHDDDKVLTWISACRSTAAWAWGWRAAASAAAARRRAPLWGRRPAAEPRRASGMCRAASASSRLLWSPASPRSAAPRCGGSRGSICSDRQKPDQISKNSKIDWVSVGLRTNRLKMVRKPKKYSYRRL